MKFLRKKNILLLITSILLLICLTFLIFTFPPTYQFPISIANLHENVSILYLFFILLCSFLFCFITFLFKSIVHGILIAIFITLYLIFRLNGLTDPFFLILLAAICLTLELAFAQSKRRMQQRKETTNNKYKVPKTQIKY